MKLTRITELDEFVKVVDSCRGDVFLVSPYGDKYNIKSKLTQYLALGKLLDVEYGDLELYCEYRDDEQKFLAFFKRYPETV